MIDIHAHVLPDVDDGAVNIRRAVEMCRLAAADGIDVVVATPHQRHEEWPNMDRSLLERLRSDLQTAVGTSPRVLLGAEIAVDSELLSELESPRGGNLIPLANSRYLLLELNPLGIGPDPLSLVHELVLDGWSPIFAHAECIPWLAEDPELMIGLSERGALFQVTAGSVTGSLGRKHKARSRALLDAGLVHFVASDMHGPVRRPPGLSAAYQLIASRWGEATARRLTEANPRAVIDNCCLTCRSEQDPSLVPSTRSTGAP